MDARAGAPPRAAWPRAVMLVAFLASLGVSAWCVFLDPVVNIDGILYLRAATAFRALEWERGLSLCRYPLYPLLIGVASRLSGLEVETAAHVLNAILLAVAFFAFIGFVRELGGGRGAAIAAAIAFLSFPTLNEYRSYITRDAGYIAFYLLALALFLRYCRRMSWTTSCAWGAAMLGAALFRLEGLTFLLALPLVLLARGGFPWPARIKMYLKANAVTALLLCSLGAYCLAHSDLGLLGSLKALGLAEPGTRMRLFVEAARALPQKAAALSQALLNEESAGYALPVVFLVLACILAAELLKKLTLLNAGLVGYAIARRLLFPAQGLAGVWVWTVVLNLLILVVYLVPQFFLAGRYPLPLSLTLLAAVPFALASLYQSWRARPSRPLSRNWLFPLVCLLVVAAAADGLISSGPSKRHLKEAGLWLSRELPRGAALFTNDRIVRFYSRTEPQADDHSLSGEEAYSFLERGEWKRYACLALRIKRMDPLASAKLQELIGSKPAAAFSDGRGDQVVIFLRQGAVEPGNSRHSARAPRE